VSSPRLLVSPDFLQSVNVSILPRDDNTYDLGSSNFRWKNGYFAGSIQLGDGTNKEILRIKGEREWALLQTGTGVGTDLRLKTLIGDKYFRLVDASDNIIAEWLLGTTDPYMALNGRLDISGIGNLGSLQIGGTEVIDASRILKNIASIAQNLLPDTDNTRNLGSPSYRWANGYFAGYLVTEGRFGVGTTTPQIIFDVRNDFDKGNWNTWSAFRNATYPNKMVGIGYDNTLDAGVIRSWELFVGNKKLIIEASPVLMRADLEPDVDNNFNIGLSFLRWKNGYFAGRVRADDGVVTKVDVGDYGGNFTNYTPPAGEEGMIMVAVDTNATTPGKRLYVYANGAWNYVDLT